MPITLASGNVRSHAGGGGFDALPPHADSNTNPMAFSAAALTVYDMCKAVDRGMVISDIRLMEKRGGRSGAFRRRG